LGIGDWGLGIGDCPIPNPQSPNSIRANLNLNKIIVFVIQIIKLEN